MISFFKKTLKLSVITAGLLGLTTVTAFAVVGKDRTRTVVHEIQNGVIDAIDSRIDDPTAMRSQLREMEQEYPKRIAQVRGDLAELRNEIRELEREREISERVVTLVDNDLARMEDAFAEQAAPGEGLVQVRAVTIDDRVYSVDRARTRLTQMKQQRVMYANRAADAEHDVQYLLKQESRLEELLAKLEGERAEFQGQIMGLSRQIDAIARNDRLIDLLEKRNRTIEECSRYEAISLDQITGRLSHIKSRQEAELDLLANAEEEAAYEDLARMQIATEELEQRQHDSLNEGIRLSDF